MSLDALCLRALACGLRRLSVSYLCGGRRGAGLLCSCVIWDLWCVMVPPRGMGHPEVGHASWRTRAPRETFLNLVALVAICHLKDWPTWHWRASALVALVASCHLAHVLALAFRSWLTWRSCLLAHLERLVGRSWAGPRGRGGFIQI